jgi:hypothetical protein
MKYLLFLVITGFSAVLCFAQTPDSVVLKKNEDRIAAIFKELSLIRDDQEKIVFNDSIVGLFENCLSLGASFSYPFDSLKHIGKIASPDKKLRIYTWNLPFSDGTHKYFGYIQYKKSKNDLVITVKLNDQSESIEEPEKKILSSENWLGALYYQVAVTKFKGEVFYTLLGFDFNDFFSSKKLVEVLYFDNDDRANFGKPVFNYEKKILHRIIFEYSARASMSLKYDPEKDLIIYDHLSPSLPSLVGKYQFYGPDFSYDALKFEDGMWKVIPDVDVRNIHY